MPSKSITGVDVCFDLDFGLLVVENPFQLVGLGIGEELVPQSLCEVFHSKNAGV